MSKIALAIGLVVGLGILTAAPAANVPSLDLDSCHDDLDRLRRNTSDAAEEAKSKSDRFEECRRDPEYHDLLGDGCRNFRHDYESALTDLESNMEDLDSRLRSVQDSCGYQFTINRMSSVEASQRRLEAARHRYCSSLKGFIGLGLTPDNVLLMCKANTDEQWCKACLGLK